MAESWFDNRAMDDLQKQINAKLEPEYSEKARAVVREVRDTMTGRPADEVYEALDAGIRDALGPGAVPNEAELRKWAAAIEAGTVTD